jgi:hypothetical protein
MEVTHPATSSAANEPSQPQFPAHAAGGLPPAEVFGLDVSLITLLAARSLI